MTYGKAMMAALALCAAAVNVSRGEGAAQSAGLRIDAVCARCQPKVPEMKDLGWIRLVNDGAEAVNLRDYAILGVNRGKAIKAKNRLRLLDREVAPHASTLVYTSEAFPNGEKGTTVAEYAYGAYGRIMVVPKKLNQKKYPMVQLSRGDEVLQTVIVPVDLADEAVHDAVRDRRPTVSSLYGVDKAADPWRAFPKAKAGEDYAVELPILPADMSAADADRIAEAHLIYRVGLGPTLTNETAMAAVDTNGTDGVVYRGKIPGAALARGGQLVQFAVAITDGAGRTFRAPSFRNPDDGCEWYGTIVEPGTAEGEGAESAALQTFHLFVDAASRSQMDVDADRQDLAKVPYNARCGIYDSTTGLYYDNVRIDLRGNTSASLPKKSHGLRFSKAQPLTCTDPVTGTEVAEIRKSSFTAEYVDPSSIRQCLAFYLFRRCGSPAPFHYPVRLNLNGAFFQLAFHTERFTDELIEDCYGLDPLGYSYKNVGTFTKLATLAGAIEKKTPDDDNEADLSVLSAFIASLKDSGVTAVTETPGGPADEGGIASATRLVVEKFDLPAWLNYLAAARLTHENDDVWANLSAYYDVNGTGTWMPLGYDMNLTFGQYYRDGSIGKRGSVADYDWYKSHPFFGGRRVRCHDREGGSAILSNNDSNWAVEAVWQNPKFRRLYLRRLRTLMDRELKAPGTPRAQTPFWTFASNVVERMSADAALDRGKYGWPNVNTMIWDWTRTFAGCAEGLEDIWTNYVEPRRAHLFVTHAATNTARTVGYAWNLNAGIPPPQAPSAELAAGFSVVAAADGRLVADGALRIHNANPSAVDLSGWTLSGAVEWTLPPGTVVDAGDELTVVADRKGYVAAHADALADRVIVGNAAFGDAARNPLVLKDAGGETVMNVFPPPIVSVGGAVSTPGVDFRGAKVVLELGKDFCANGRAVSAVLALPGQEEPVAGTVDLDGRTVTFEVAAATAAAASVSTGRITLAVGEERLERSVALVQGRTVVVEASEGWIRVGEAEIADAGADVVPETAAPETARVTLKVRAALGFGEAFAATDHAGVRVVACDDVDRYVFKTGEGDVTNFTAIAVMGREVEFEMIADYAERTIVYVVGGETNGPFALGADARRASCVRLGGCGHLARLEGDYEVMGLDANLARAGGVEYPTVAAAVAAGGTVDLLWDASWTPTQGGRTVFATHGRQLVLRGDLVAKVVDNGDGTVTVTVNGGTPEAPKSVSIRIEGMKILIGVSEPKAELEYGVKRATALGPEEDFKVDENSWVSGEELLDGKAIEVEKKTGATAEFFKVETRAKR